jgi:hypothetical protein
MVAIRREGSSVRFRPALVDADDLEASGAELIRALSGEGIALLIIEELDARTPSAHHLARLVRWASEEAERAGVGVAYRL